MFKYCTWLGSPTISEAYVYIGFNTGFIYFWKNKIKIR